MKFERYSDVEQFAAETLETLLENEVQNNLLISFANNKTADSSNWLLSSIKDANGDVILVAACTPPFNLVLYETGNTPNDAALKLLSDELKGIGYAVPGVLAEQGLAHRFAKTHTVGFHLHMSMNIMRLDKVNNIEKTSGFCRALNENDLFYAPYWERAFSEECKVHVSSVQEIIERIEARIKTGNHFIWEDGHPVSMATHRRSTQNGSGVNSVYTPPHYRGKGYASSLVAELSRTLLARGNKFCFLFADANNPVSCGIYRKIGYYDLCVFDEVRFDK